MGVTCTIWQSRTQYFTSVNQVWKKSWILQDAAKLAFISHRRCAQKRVSHQLLWHISPLILFTFDKISKWSSTNQFLLYQRHDLDDVFEKFYDSMISPTNIWGRCVYIFPFPAEFSFVMYCVDSFILVVWNQRRISNSKLKHFQQFLLPRIERNSSS